VKPTFVYTKNVKNFVATMQLVEKRMGHDSLAMIWGRAGRGKTRTAKWYATQHDCVYVESLRDWSVLWMYQDILRAMGVESFPKRKKQAFEAIIDISQDDSRPIILDEADLVGPRLLESIRDLCKTMMVPWVLIGEESLPVLMSRDRRVWSRRCASLEFQPMHAPDIISFCKKATELDMPGDTADTIQKASGGDVRLIEMVLSTGETIANANNKKEVSLDIALTAIKKVIPEKGK